jgi:WD40 repeat protein
VVVSGSDDGTVRVWDVERAIQLRELDGHSDWVRAVAVFPDGKHVASVSDDHTIRIWDLGLFKSIQVIDTGFDWLRVLAVSKDSSVLFTADDSENIKVWDWQAGQQIGLLTGHAAKINAIKALTDGRVISVSDDRTLRIWDVSTKREINKLVGHTGRIVACAVMNDESALLTAGTDKNICLWEIGRGGEIEPRIVTDKAHWVRDLAFVQAGRRIISASEDRELEVWDVASGSRAAALKGHTDWVSSVSASPEGELAVSASDDSTLKIWRLGGGKLKVSEVPRHNGLVRTVACVPDDAIAYSAGSDRKLMTWEINTGALSSVFDEVDIHRIAVFPNGACFASAEGDAVVRVRSTQDCSVQSVFRKHADRVRAVSVSEDGSFVASSGDDRFIRIWEAASGEEVSYIQVGTHIRALAFLEGTETILSGSVSGRIKLLSISTGEILSDFDGHAAQINSLEISSVEQVLLSASDDHTLRVWDLMTGECRFILEGHVGRVRDLALNGKTAVSVAEDSTVRIWDMTNGVQLAVFTGESPFLSCSFSADARRVIAGDRQGYVHFLEPKVC